MLHQEAKLSLG